MQKLLLLLSMIVWAVIFAANPVIAQERGNEEARVSPNAVVSQTIGTTVVTLNYGRPALKNRSYFEEDSELAPTGTVWRTGANEPTVITFSGDVSFGGENVEAGSYALFTQPGDEEWDIILSEDIPRWGTQYDESGETLRVSADVEEGENLEWFQIYFDDLSETQANLILHWGTTKVSVPISVE